MKRDLALLKTLLQKACNIPNYGDYLEVTDEEFGFPPETETIKYHLLLLMDSGFIEARLNRDGGGLIKRLTNKGHDFLDLLNNETIWQKIKNKFAKTPDMALSAIYDVGIGVGIATITEFIARHS
ncbi:MAG: DUF2513 domain-containing protein [Planctomycetaceae bacterium]|jgi:DNA-binding PadR family transcriptional regulator|nr:DUF2513 domain-containing protein [Planctomycetaceae bacterium]